MSSIRSFIDLVEHSTQPASTVKPGAQRIVEMPYIQDTALDFGLQDIENNKQRAATLISKGARPIFDQEGYTLYRLGDGRGYYFMLDDKRLVIEYFIEFEPTVLPKFGSGVTQIKLWRSQTFALSGITRRVFFDYLLKEFGCVISDESQTYDGKRFWIGAMGFAVRTGLKVGFYDHGVTTICEGDYTEWLQEQDAWGEDLHYFNKRFFIRK